MQWSVFLFYFFALLEHAIKLQYDICKLYNIWLGETQRLKRLGAKPILRVKQKHGVRAQSGCIAHRVFKLCAH